MTPGTVWTSFHGWLYRVDAAPDARGIVRVSTWHTSAFTGVGAWVPGFQFTLADWDSGFLKPSSIERAVDRGAP